MNVFWQHFTEILTDPAHSAVEFTFVLLDYLVIQTVAHRLKRHFHHDLASEHQRLDVEHGIEHDPEALDRRLAAIREQADRLQDALARLERLDPESEEASR